MKNFLKGILVGIGNITPGLSGSGLLIIFNMYEKCLKHISNMIKHPKESFIFLFPIALGILIGTVFFSNIILYLFNNYEDLSKLVFMGFIIGTIPGLFKEAHTKKTDKISYLFFIICLSLGFLFAFKLNTKLNFNNYNFFILFLTGGIVAFSTIIPGISGTIILNILGLYNIYIFSISHLYIKNLIPILIGFIVFGFIISKLIYFLLKRYYSYTYFSILGFLLSSLFALVPRSLNNIYMIILGIILFIFSFFTTYKLDKFMK